MALVDKAIAVCGLVGRVGGCPAVEPERPGETDVDILPGLVIAFVGFAHGIPGIADREQAVLAQGVGLPGDFQSCSGLGWHGGTQFSDQDAPVSGGAIVERECCGSGIGLPGVADRESCGDGLTQDQAGFGGGDFSHQQVGAGEDCEGNRGFGVGEGKGMRNPISLL